MKLLVYHGEKLYESLLSREEMSRVEDNKFFRIPQMIGVFMMYFFEGKKY